MTLISARATGFSVLLALSFFTRFAKPVEAQPIIDDKFVGGPMDQNNGYEDPSKFVIASNNAMFVSCPNGIFESVNLGLSWAALTSSSVADFCFGPDSTLYLAGANGVYSSTNFGSTWSNLNTQLPNGPFSSVIVTPDGTIFTGCSSGLFRSTDGGTDWDHIAQTEIPFGGSLYLTVTPKGTVLARNGNSYFRSTDGGNTWVTSVPLTIQIWAVSANNILRQSDNGLERSMDDGVSWQSVPSSPKGLQYDLAIDQAGNIFTFYGYQLYISKDGGTTWSVDCTITGGGQELAFTQDHTLYFSQPSAGIWRTLKPLSAVPTEAQQPDMLLQWIPSNPTGQLLSYTLQTHSFATLSLFNILGEKVMTLADGEFGEGEHRVSLPGNPPSGAYLCVLQCGDETKTLRVLLQ